MGLRRLRNVVGVAAVCLLGWLLVSLVAAYSLTRRAHPLFAEPAPEGWEPLRLHSQDGQDIGAWIHPAALAGSAAVLMLHGNGASRSSYVSRSWPYLRAGCAVMLISLRAHGDSTGDTNDVGYSARFDVVAAVDELQKRFPDQPIVVQGASLGAAAAVFASPLLDSRVSGYILECPYLDLRTAVRNRTEIYLPTPLDRLAYYGLAMASRVMLPQFDQISVLDGLDRLPPQIPILLMAGAKDNRARPEEARLLQQKIASHSTLVMFPEGRHEALLGSDPQLYQASIGQFLRAIQGSSNHN